MGESTEKSIKLQEKLDLLIEKVENEKNPIKRHLLSFKIKMIVAKIDREIDLQNIKESCKLEIEDLRLDKEERDAKSEERIPVLEERIKLIEEEIEAYEEYDYDSPKFMYPKNYVEKIGGYEKINEKLKKSKNLESQMAAKKMDIISKKKEELKILQSAYEYEYQKLQNSDLNFEQEEKAIKKRENQLILKKKFNIFDRIKTFFGNIKEEVNEFKEERKEIKAIKNQQKAHEKYLLETYKMKQQMLKENYNNAIKQVEDNKGKQKIEEFKKQMQDYIPVIEHEEKLNEAEPISTMQSKEDLEEDIEIEEI